MRSKIKKSKRARMNTSLSPFSARRLNTIIPLGCLTVLVHISPQPSSSAPSSSIYDSTEEAIKQMIESIQRMICLHKKKEGEAAPSITINPAIKKHFELQIKTLQTAPRDVWKLERIIKAKEKRREEDISMHVEDMQRLVTEIEMLKLVLFLVNRNSSSCSSTSVGRP